MAWPLTVWWLNLALLWLGATARDVYPQKENYLPDYRLYHNLSTVTSVLQRLLQAHPDRISVHHTYKSGELRQIQVLRLPPARDGVTEPSAQKVLRVLLVFGEHAREFMPVESALHLLQRVVSDPNSALSRLLRHHFDLYVIPLLNPDGRARIERSANYCWRGTASGVDLERNFPWEFGAGSKADGSSTDQNDEEFRGSRPFSEAESRVIRDLSAAVTFDAALSFHSGIRHIYIPFSDSRSRKTGRLPTFWKAMAVLASKMKKAMGNNPKHSFDAGPASKLNDYPSDGTLFDYLAGVRMVPASLVVELWGVGDRPGLKCFDVFNPQSNVLKEELQRLTPLYEAFFSGLWSLRSNFSSASVSTKVNVLRHHSTVLPYPLIALFGVIILLLGVVCKQRMHSSATPWRQLASGRKRVVSLRSFSSRFSGLTGLKSV